MKKFTALLIALCCILTSIPFSACAREIIETTPDPAGYAVIRDEDGNIVEELDVSVALKDVSKSRSGVTTYEITYTAVETKTDDGTSVKDGVTAVGTITWNDFFGYDNQLVSVSGHWTLDSRTISNLVARYGAMDILGNVTNGPFYPEEMNNPFSSDENNLTGYTFYLYTCATINQTGNTIELFVTTELTT